MYRFSYFLVFMELYSLENKNGGVGIEEPAQGTVNGPVDHSCKRVVCYKLPVVQKVFRPLLKR